ncbi:hypothetical protein QQS45_04090 [Alteriqipengyuania flavescens]|uniref:hypothetical protein n=1 Tax=Alteriqipengyuania flavescens TaxID=3053610 RepID=UPI0025B40483|nr:hypothetical protein [Alteriqipengyuania flavescens]WJY19418.1 hypothetical protein QQW98_04085 [Alteriqipengyuania flavescens]WJY25360.1 hypothetical protein QQS45_04090 [Alteriqipengyuania flavescens]
MSDNNNDKRPSDFDGERKQTDELAPENENAEQVDAYAQAQNVADQAMDRATSVLGAESDHVKSAAGEPDAQDTVDHMKQMDRSGEIDMSAYKGEPNHDDNVDKYGKPSKVDDLRGDGT